MTMNTAAKWGVAGFVLSLAAWGCEPCPAIKFTLVNAGGDSIRTLRLCLGAVCASPAATELHAATATSVSLVPKGESSLNVSWSVSNSRFARELDLYVEAGQQGDVRISISNGAAKIDDSILTYVRHGLCRK